jgi:TatD DNase family protein
MTNLPSHFRAGRPHVLRWPRVRLGLGLHPLAAESHARELPEFEAALSLTSFVGEIGLDLSRHGKATAERQLQSFRQVAALLALAPKFVSLHSRGAEREVLEILAEHRVERAVFHWYSGSVGVLDGVLEAGHSLSVNPAMTLSAKGKEIIKRLPRDRVLTETDGPHVQVRGTAAKPWDVQLVYEHLARVWGTSVADASAQVWANFQVLMGRIRASEVPAK